jgi:hypothetical protein
MIEESLPVLFVFDRQRQSTTLSIAVFEMPVDCALPKEKHGNCAILKERADLDILDGTLCLRRSSYI